MIDAAIVGLGWWGKNIVNAVQGKSKKLRFVHGVSKEIDAALPLAEANGFTLSDDLEKALSDPKVKAFGLQARASRSFAKNLCHSSARMPSAPLRPAGKRVFPSALEQTSVSGPPWWSCGAW